jgi:hypothetical protein
VEDELAAEVVLLVEAVADVVGVEVEVEVEIRVEVTVTGIDVVSVKTWSDGEG